MAKLYMPVAVNHHGAQRAKGAAAASVQRKVMQDEPTAQVRCN
jgi:hypothetical protein